MGGVIGGVHGRNHYVVHPINSSYWLILPNPGMHTSYTKLDQERPFPGPALTIASCNIEGINSRKQEPLAELCKDNFYATYCVCRKHVEATKWILRSSMEWSLLLYDQSAIFVRSSIPGHVCSSHGNRWYRDPRRTCRKMYRDFCL